VSGHVYVCWGYRYLPVIVRFCDCTLHKEFQVAVYFKNISVMVVFLVFHFIIKWVSLFFWWHQLLHNIKRGLQTQALVSFKKYMPPPLPYFKVATWNSLCKVQSQNRTITGKYRYPQQTYTWPLTVSAWYRLFNKKWQELSRFYEHKPPCLRKPHVSKMTSLTFNVIL
jgi:hypothetical protein